jgi:hypothetical protein
MALNRSRSGMALYAKQGAAVVNTIAALGSRQTAASDDAAKFYARYRPISCYLYADLDADVVEDTTGAMDVFVEGCNEVSLQPTNGATLTFKGSLDGVTFGAVSCTAGADGIYRITGKYRWLRVLATKSTANYSVYLLIS